MFSTAINGQGALLPPLEAIHSVSKKIAFAVAVKAIEQGVAPKYQTRHWKEQLMPLWNPVYRRYKRTAF